jgi:hypothetical protein
VLRFGVKGQKMCGYERKRERWKYFNISASIIEKEVVSGPGQGRIEITVVSF